MSREFLALLVLTLLSELSLASYSVIRDYSGVNFFSPWNFYAGPDSYTLGNVQFTSQSDAASQGLAYVNTAGNAVIRVDNSSTVDSNGTRNSVRLTSIDSYPLGSLWIIDAVHIPFGCSVWPSFWSVGAQFPNDSQIDSIEAVNQMQHAQMSLHTRPGCFQAANVSQTGQSAATNCTQDTGCVVGINKPNSFGAAFAQAGGGVFATQFDASGIFIWFWSRPDVPASINQSSATSSIDLSDWGTPTAAYPASGCKISDYFQPQSLVLEITLCGIWAGAPEIYNATCGRGVGSTGLCYNDNVVGIGSPKYDNAYFEIKFIRSYFPSGSPMPSISTATPGTNPPKETSSSLPNPDATSSAVALYHFPKYVFHCVVLRALGGLLYSFI